MSALKNITIEAMRLRRRRLLLLACSYVSNQFISGKTHRQNIYTCGWFSVCIVLTTIVECWNKRGQRGTHIIETSFSKYFDLLKYHCRRAKREFVSVALWSFQQYGLEVCGREKKRVHLEQETMRGEEIFLFDVWKGALWKYCDLILCRTGQLWLNKPSRFSFLFGNFSILVSKPV